MADTCASYDPNRELCIEYQYVGRYVSTISVTSMQAVLWSRYISFQKRRTEQETYMFPALF